MSQETVVLCYAAMVVLWRCLKTRQPMWILSGAGSQPWVLMCNGWLTAGEWVMQASKSAGIAL